MGERKRPGVPTVAEGDDEYELRAMLFHAPSGNKRERSHEHDPFWAEDYADDPPLSARSGKPRDQYSPAQLRALQAGGMPVIGTPATPDAAKVPDADDWREQQDVSQQVEPYTLAYTAGTIATPPFDPLQMSMMAQTCDVIPPTLDALVVNIEQQGYEFKHWDDDVDENDAESKAQKDAAEAFYETGVGPNVRPGLREDKVLTGNAYVEVLRENAAQARWRCRQEVARGARRAEYSPSDMAKNVDPEGGDVRKPYSLVVAPSFLTRICVPDVDSKAYVLATEYRRVAGEWAAVKVRRRFRKFVQVEPSTGRYRFFKEFGDPRTLDAETGRYQEAGKTISATKRATEIYHFGRPTRTSPYEVPKFAAALMAIGGYVKFEELNYLYAENKGVPPMFVLVSGGTLTGQSVKRVEEKLQQAKGLSNFHSVMVLEATSKTPAKGDAFSPAAPAASTVKIEVKSMMDAIQKDALFMGYLALQQRIIRGIFRVPAILMGMSEDYSFATASVSLKMFEEQVCKPARSMFDDFINHCIYPALGVHDWYFQSLGIKMGNPQDMASLINAGVAAGAGSPSVYGKVLSEALGVEFPEPDEAIADQPFALTLANSKIAATPALFSTETRGGESVEAAVERALLGAAEAWAAKTRAA